MCRAFVSPVPPSRTSVHLPGLFGMFVHLSGLSGLFVYLSMFICVSAFTPHATFHYELLMSRRAEDCKMCFADECWSLQRDRCQYYAEAHEAMDKTEVGGSPGEVDELMHDMVGQASASWMAQECIPLISHRTDCNKENICVGCKTCSCDVFGKWSCKDMQQCRTELYLDVDHRVLVYVEEALKNDTTMRKKRSIEEKTEKPTAVSHKISYADITEWMYGVKPEVSLDAENKTKSNRKSPEYTTSKTDDVDANYIEFDEVLKNIANDHQKYKRRKPQSNKVNYKFKELDDIVVAKSNDTDQFLHILNAIVDGNESSPTEPNVEQSTTVVIDLLTSFKRDEHFNTSDFVESNSNILKEENISDETDNRIILDAINIMKRDLSSVTKINFATESTIGEYNNTTKPVAELKNNVLIPLNKIIDDKQQELKDLLKIKEHLVKFIKDHNSTALYLNGNFQEAINTTSTVLSIYNVDVFPEIQVNLRKINPNMLEKLLYKLQRDIYEVIRDVVGIKKLSEANNLPEDLKSLIRAMSFYVRKQGNVTKLQNGIKLKDDKDLRRQIMDNERNANFNSTKDYLIQILKLIDKDKPLSDALSPLPQPTRKIIKRVIKNYYVDEFSTIGMMVYDPEYNLTNDLRNIGNTWQIMTENIAKSALTDKIYAMKLLHLTLSADVNKMNDALALIDFAHSRRMIPIEGSLGEELLDQINRGLKSIDDKIQTIIKYKMGLENKNKINPKMKPSKRKSFMNKLRNLLKGSKKDIVELVNKNVPRSEIVKTIAKKRLDELAQKKISDYADTMRKWQTALNIIPRNKRSLDSGTIKNRMKNIIPKYLRGKLNPAIVAKKNNKNYGNTQNEGTLKKSINAKQRRIVSTTTIIAAKPKNDAKRRRKERKSEVKQNKTTDKS